MNAQIAHSTVYNIIDFWEYLKERFLKGDNFKISNFLQKIHSIK